MPVVKGGVWTNIEDEILKAAVSKYGLNQWARVSSLLARKTPKQCKARWSEWLDPSIRKIEWSRDEDEKLLHLAKLMPTQWRTIAPIVGRTATQCLERYQRLLDEAEAREGAEELALGGPDGGEGVAPSADDVRRLRPGELDPDPESKPARPDTIDLDEDEKEMLSEARARLANTQGKKAKRKARERQLEESRRLAVLQKRRELKNAGINVKVTTKKKGQMDYNADIPFEKAPAPGFYDTQEELAGNEREREAFDPRKRQLANKRKGDAAESDEQQSKRAKKGNDSGASAFAAAAKAGQQQRIREAEQSSKRRSLVLPTPQVSEAELEDIVKMGMSTGPSENGGGLTGNYSASMIGATPIRTPRAPQEEDRIANELRNARARTDTQSALLGGENNYLADESVTTGLQGAAPSARVSSTPNPLATPLRTGMAGPPGATPMRTPRDSLRLNQADGSGRQLVPQTPRDLRLHDLAVRNNLRGKLASLPRPKETDFELELPEEVDEAAVAAAASLSKEDAAVRDARNAALARASALAELKRQSSVVQKGLPRPSRLDVETLRARVESTTDSVVRAVETEMLALMAHDAATFGGAHVTGKTPNLVVFGQEAMDQAKMEVVLEMGETVGDSHQRQRLFGRAFEEEWLRAHASRVLPGLSAYEDEEVDETAAMKIAFEDVQATLISSAEKSAGVEKKLQKVQGGYIARSRALRQKIADVAEVLERTRLQTETARVKGVTEEAGVQGRLEGLRAEVQGVVRREREAQEIYRGFKEELQALDA